MRIHLDTDFAGDTDDAAALALLLGSPDVDLVGVTTVADPDGVRAGYVRYVLALAGRDDIPVAAGAGASLTTGGAMGTVPDHGAYWGDAVVAPEPPVDGAAIDLMATGIAQGAVLVAIGPYTNLALLEAAQPGTLAATRVVLMGGWVIPPAEGLPPWGPAMDWNVQCDTDAAVTVLDAAADLTLVTLPATLGVHLREMHTARLERAGPIGRLMARQARAHSAEHQMGTLGRAHAGLPDDLLNFQYDPVACAVAFGWDGVTIESMPLAPEIDDGVLRFAPSDAGKAVNVVTAVDNDAFDDLWLSAIERLGNSPSGE